MSGFYVKPPELLSQGDIVTNVPWGLIEAPTTLCRPIDRTKPSGKARYSSVEPWDMHGSPLAWARDPELIHAVGREGVAMILWHGCQIDKSESQERSRPDKAFAAVAPVLALDTLNATDADLRKALMDGVRSGKHASYFFLPATKVGALELPESFVNLRYIWSVRQSTLANRQLSIAPSLLPSLYEKMFTFFTRFRLDLDPKCPTCGTPVPLSMVAEEE